MFSRFCDWVRGKSAVVGGAALVALSVGSVPAFAQGPAPAVTFDPAPILAIVTDAQAFIVTIGLAVLTLIMVAKGIRWARKAG